MGRRGRSDCNMGGSGGLQEVTYAVPADKCGLVIGKGKVQVHIKCLSADLNTCCCCKHLSELFCFVCIAQTFVNSC